MSQPNTAIDDHIARELALTEHEADEAPITMVCEPLGTLDGSSCRGRFSLRLMACSPPEEARGFARMLQARVKGLCHLEASGGEGA